MRCAELPLREPRSCECSAQRKALAPTSAHGEPRRTATTSDFAGEQGRAGASLKSRRLLPTQIPTQEMIAVTSK